MCVHVQYVFSVLCVVHVCTCTVCVQCVVIDTVHVHHMCASPVLCIVIDTVHVCVQCVMCSTCVYMYSMCSVCCV